MMNMMYLNSPMYYPGALPDATPAVIASLQANGDTLYASALSRLELDAFEALCRRGYLTACAEGVYGVRQRAVFADIRLAVKAG